MEKVQFLKAGYGTDKTDCILMFIRRCWCDTGKRNTTLLLSTDNIGFVHVAMTSAWKELGQIGLIKTESIVKHRISRNWLLFDWNPVFLGEKRERLHLGRTFPGGCECMGPPVHHFTNTARLALKQRKHVEATAQDAGKVGKITTKLVACPSIKRWAVPRLLVRIRWCVVLQILST